MTATLKKTPVRKLQTAMKAGGLPGDIGLHNQAAEVQGNLSRQHGWRVTRVTDEVGNPLLGTPTPGSKRSFRSSTGRLEEGQDPSSLEHVELVHEPEGPTSDTTATDQRTSPPAR